MKTIFWTQNETPTTPTTLLIDGKLVEDTEEKQEGFNNLLKCADNVVFTPKHRETFCKKNKLYSSQVNYARPSKGGIYIQGTFTDLDEANRRMPYMFYTACTDDFKEARSILIKQASSLNRTCDSKELDELEKYDEKKKGKKRTSRYVIGAIIITAIAISLMSIND